MEGLSLCLIALSTLLAVWFLKLISSGNSKHRKQLPPGPWTLPIIGSLHHVVSALPHRMMMELSRRHGELMHLKLGEVPTVVVSSAEAVSLVMKSNDLAFASRPRSVTRDIVGCEGKGIILAPYGDCWRQMRKVCIVELLSPKQVRRAVGVRSEEVAQLLRSVAAAGTAVVNVSEKMSALSNDMVARAVFGGRCARQGEYLREFHELIPLIGGFYLVDLFPSSRLVRWLSSGERHARRSCGRCQRIIADIIEGRKAARSAGDGACSNTDDEEDLLDVLLRLQEEDSLEFPLTSDIIGTVIFDMFGAATDTSATVLEWAMSELVKNPKVMAKVQLEVRKALGENRGVITNDDFTELHYMRKVIKEVLRLHPPAPIISREAREDCKIMGYDIPKGTSICINIFSISRDPRYWNNPEEFNPDRSENNKVDYNGTHSEFTPFGTGRRQCPGMLYGLSTLEIALANLLYHFDWMLPDGASTVSLDMSEKFGLIVHRRSDLKLIAIPYVCSKATYT